MTTKPGSGPKKRANLLEELEDSGAALLEDLKHKAYAAAVLEDLKPGESPRMTAQEIQSALNGPWIVKFPEDSEPSPAPRGLDADGANRALVMAATDDTRGARTLFRAGHVNNAMSELSYSFHFIRRLNPPGISPWKPLALRAWLVGKGRACSPSEQLCIHFVLSVWNPLEAARVLGPFDVMDALMTWDSAHRAAFIGWARNPWWP